IRLYPGTPSDPVNSKSISWWKLTEQQPLLLPADISQTPQLLERLLVHRGLCATAQKTLDLLLGTQPRADLRHHAADFLRVLARNVLGLSAIGTAVVQLDFVHPHLLGLVAVDELPAGIEQRHRVSTVLRHESVRSGIGMRIPRRHHRASPLEWLALGERCQALPLHHVRDLEAQQIENR